MPGIQLPYTDRFGTLHPQAWGEIVRMRVELGTDGFAADHQLFLYHDQQARLDGLPAFEERPMNPLTDMEIAALVQQFQPAVYGILLQRDEFKDATIVP